MNKIVIIGSSGFIGSDLKKLLLNNKHKVFAPNSIKLNILKEEDYLKHSKKFVDASIVYCAGKHRQYGDTIENMSNNIIGLNNFLKYLNPKNIKKFIFLSSAEVYGKIYNKIKISELTPVNPSNYYSLSKLTQELALKLFFKDYKEKLFILRLPGIYGINDNNTSIISKIISNITNHQSFNLTTDGRDLRDYIYVRDLSKIIYKIIKLKKINLQNNIINICSGETISINNLIKLIEKIHGNNLKIVKKEVKTNTTYIIFKKNIFLKNQKFKKLKSNIYNEYFK